MKKEEETMYDVVIIGGGPAGLTAAIYCLRANLSILILEKETMGGKLSKTYKIENYPGFKEINGADLANHFINQVKNLNADIKEGNVISIKNNKDEKDIVLDTNEIIKTKTIIIATGTKEKTLDLPKANEFIGNGISYCAVCDGFFYRKKDVAIIGGGNSALEEALYLSSLVNKIYIVIRRDVFRAEKSIINKILNNPKIEIIKNHLPESLIIKDDKIAGLNIKDVSTNKVTKIDCNGIFPYIGSLPNTNFVPEEILDENKYIIVNKNMETKTKGIYAAGDVINKNLRQIVTATSDGAIAANSAINYLHK